MSAEVELLRRAAALMRERAQAASPGPWSAGDVDDAGSVVFRYGDYGFYITGPAGSPEFADSEQGQADALHVASWHPAVALAVADWLDAEADHHEARDRALTTATSSGEWYVRLSASTLPQSVAVARAYLGESS